MLVLAIKTDQKIATIKVIKDSKVLSSLSWNASDKLSVNLLQKIAEITKTAEKKLSDYQGIAVFSGPGSFTGLRISASTANALAYALTLPVVGETGREWQKKAIKRLENGENDTIVEIDYGMPANITKPKK